MTRIMYDAITPANCPTDGALYAGYVAGNWPSYQEMVRRFPNAVHVSIAVQADQDAQVLDCEPFDATPEQCPDWVLRQRARGQIPTVYCNASTWNTVKAAFHARGVDEPLWWIANYDGVPHIPPGAIAKQYLGDVEPGYDVSVVADYWPGVDPIPTPTPVPPSPIIKDGQDMGFVVACTGKPLLWKIEGCKSIPISYAALQALGRRVERVDLGIEDYNAFQKATS